MLFFMEHCTVEYQILTVTILGGCMNDKSTRTLFSLCHVRISDAHNSFSWSIGIASPTKITSFLFEAHIPVQQQK